MPVVVVPVRWWWCWCGGNDHEQDAMPTAAVVENFPHGKEPELEEESKVDLEGERSVGGYGCREKSGELGDVLRSRMGFGGKGAGLRALT